MSNAGVPIEMVEQTISSFIVNNFLFGDAATAPARDLPLVQSGLVDSTGILEIVTFLESEFGVHTSDEELAVGNFGSIETIARFVVAKQD
ncbi:MAG TPA: acyl carrier protein [Kofleriaceae bacterium]